MGGEKNEGARLARSEVILKGVEEGEVEVRPVVEAGAADHLLAKGKAEGANKDERPAEADAEAANGAGIVRDFGMNKDNIHHWQSPGNRKELVFARDLFPEVANKGDDVPLGITDWAGDADFPEKTIDRERDPTGEGAHHRVALEVACHDFGKELILGKVIEDIALNRQKVTREGEVGNREKTRIRRACEFDMRGIGERGDARDIFGQKIGQPCEEGQARDKAAINREVKAR